MNNERQLEDFCGIFFDVQNLYYGANNLFENSKLDYKKLYDKIVNHKICGRKRIVNKGIAYIVRSEDNLQENFKKFLIDTLKLEIKEKIIKPYLHHLKANWDSAIIVDIIKYINEYNVIALCSGDGDFVPLVKYLRENGKYVEIYAFERSTSEELIKIANKVWFLRKRHLLLPKENKC